MCGIVGVMRYDGASTEAAVLEQMTAALSHRGPDAIGTDLRQAGSVHVGLGHTRLKIVDLSAAADQPMSNEDGSVRVVFNGEIYNFRELREQLIRRGCLFRTASDTEVLMRLYEVEGEACVNRLEGMFAFAIWDERRRRLLVARDRVGKKPLFYTAAPGLFACASELKALLHHPQIPVEVNHEALPALFLFGYVPAPSTCYRGILKLPPGHRLIVESDGRLQIDQYWEIPLRSPTDQGPSEAEAMATVRELMTAAVRRRLIADVPLGAFLSGGIDSSIIVAVMSQLMAEPVKTFSIGFSDDARFDETAYARLVAQQFHTSHTEFIVRPSAVKLVEELVRHFDGPFSDSSAIPTYLLSQLTRQQVTVALTGDGGDELFAGYLRFYATLVAERVPLSARRMAREALAVLPAWGGHRSLLTRLQKFAKSAALPFDERFTRWIAVFYEDLSRLLPQACAEENGHPPAPLRLLAPYLAHADQTSPLTRLLYLNMKTYLADDLLVKMDRCSMAHGLEARSPFLDRELIEYVMKLPDALKVRWGQTKVVLRRAFANRLPPAILRRGKMGFGVPLRTWFCGPLRPFIHELLLGPDARLRQYVDQQYVRVLCEAHWSRRANHADRLWMLLTFEIWLRNLSLTIARRPPSRFCEDIVTS